MTNLNSLPGRHVLLSIALAGLIGEIAFEIYAWTVSPLLFGVTLQPSNLVIALAAKLAGMSLPYEAAFVIHFMIGAFGFGAVVYLVLSAMPSKVWLAGLIAGVLLWFVAQGLLAPLIGRSFMMGFGTYTQSSFVGHVGMTVIMAQLLAGFLPRFRSRAAAAMGA